MATTTEAPTALLPKPRIVALSAVVALALLTASCGAPTAPPNIPAPERNAGAGQAVPTRGPGAQPTPPGGSVSVPEVPALSGPPELPSRTPGEQPVDSGPVVMVPTTQEAPPTLIPPVTESTSTTKPSAQLPIPELP